MARIEIITTKEEQDRIIEVLKDLKDRTIAVSEIARIANMNPNRTRYVIADLVEFGRVKRVPTKAFNEHYIRYKYEVAQ